MNLVTAGRPEHIDLAVPPLTPGKPSGQTMRQIVDGYSKYVTKDWARAVNVEYRAGVSGPSVSVIAEGGNIYSQGDPRWPVMLATAQGLTIKDAPTQAELLAARWAFGAGPWLIRDGKPTDLLVEIKRGGYDQWDPRAKKEQAGIGVRADGVAVHWADTNASIEDSVDALLSLGCVNAIKLDSGGSTCVMDASGKILLGYSVRQVCCALVFRKLIEEPAPSTIVVPQTGIIDYSQRITDNFTWGEFACKGETCGCNHALMVGPMFFDLVPRLQRMRTRAGQPFHITSGTRCAKHDRAVGTSGSPGFGPHTTGGAIDGWIERLSLDEMANLARSEGITGIGKYPNLGFVHLDMLGREFTDERR